VIRDPRIAHSTEFKSVMRNRRQLVVLPEIQAHTNSYEQRVAGLERKHTATRYAIQLEQSTMGRETVVQAVVNNREVERIVFKRQALDILIAPLEWRKLGSGEPR